MVEKAIGDKMMRLVKADITKLEVDAFVHDITEDLKLGSGFGSAIQQRGGIVIQKELDELGHLDVGEAVITQAGILKAEYIIHANGPKFKEEDEAGKLRNAVKSSLRLADEKGMKRIAFPAIGTGVYQVPMDLCAQVMVDTVAEHLGNGSTLDEVLFVVQDTREFKPFEAKMKEGV
jgi:O-acetyl-ADP-ribose deacetylase (regulator of RNase III)